MQVFALAIMVAVASVGAAVWFARDPDGTFSQPGLVGVALGTGLGIFVVVITLLSLKKAFSSTKSTTFMGHITGGFAMKLAGAILIGAAIAIANGETQAEVVDGKEHVFHIEKVRASCALVSYIGVVFFGYAVQAKLVQARRTRDRETPASRPNGGSADTPGPGNAPGA